MRFLAALALLLQFQPLMGAVLCFRDAEVAQAECATPHDDRPADRTLTAPGAEMPTGCASLGYCAPAAPAVPKFTEYVRIASPTDRAPALLDASMALGDPLAPPFHPPRA